MPTPEALARQIIDQTLTAAGWIVRDFGTLNLGVGPGVAVLPHTPQILARGQCCGIECKFL